MLRTNWMKSSKATKDYFAKTDYYASCPGDWLGKGAEMLGLVGSDNAMHFHSLADNLDPRTGKTLRPHAKDGDRVGMDFTFNSTKSVGIAREMAGVDNAGDPRIEEAHREAVGYAVGLIEADMQTRVRVGGADHDRVTGNLVAYRVTHRDTRINPDDGRPDPNLHDHVFVFNTTFDSVERKWKACQLGQVKHDAPYYEAAYHNRLASNLRDLGYGVRRKDKAFEIAGVTDELVKKFSRRSEHINGVAAKLGITKAASKAKLGATTRLGKATELADDLNGYYVSRLTNEEKERLAHLDYAGSRYVSDERKAVAFAVGHLFERQSVVDERKLYEAALRHGIGSVTLDGVIEEAQEQGVLLKNRQATTRGVLAEESRIIDFAREGKGTMRPLAATPPLTELQSIAGQRATALSRPDSQPATPAAHGQQKGRSDESKRPADMVARRSGHDPDRVATLPAKADPATPLSEPQAVIHTAENGPKVKNDRPKLSPEQCALVNHILTSPDRVVLVVGDAGTGKTSAVRSAFDRIHCPVAMMAPSAEASRGVLRKEGFSNADTVASFLLSSQRQNAVKDGVIWVDEAGLLPIRDLSRLTDIAKDQNARIVLQGDPKQHRSVARHGNMMNVLEEYAGLKVGRLTEIWRQKHRGYRQVVADVAAGKREKAFDGLTDLGWVQTVDDHGAIVSDYLAGERAGKDQLLIAPSHAEGDAITGEIRARLHADGKLGEDRQVKQLVNLNWSTAERGDMERFTGDETLVFYQNSGAFKKGEVVRVADLTDKRRWKSPEHFGVFREEKLAVAAGDLIRITQGGASKDGHRLNNGAVYRVKGFDKDGGIVLDNDWTLKSDFGHLAHGYVGTSHASQGKTVDRVLVAMGSASRGAMNAEQFYVSLSRAKFEARVYTDLPPAELKQAIGRTDTRKSATELMKPRRKPKASRVKWWMEKARDRFKKLHEMVRDVTKVPERQRERDYAHER